MRCQDQVAAPTGSLVFLWAASAALSACVPRGDEPGHAAVDGRRGARATQARTEAPAPGAPARPAAGTETGSRAQASVRERSLGVRDTGVFSDLDPRIQLTLPRGLERQRIHAAVDRVREQLVLYDETRPVKVYPLAGEGQSVPLVVGDVALSLRPGDRDELSPLLEPERLFVFEERVELPPGDVDDDGIPDPLDILIGAHKAALNGARYDGRYIRIGYPGGDVPREIGVCTDVIVRATRNAGLDLQAEVQADIRTRPGAFPGVKRQDPNIDHRRIKTVLPYFERHWQARSPRADDPDDPLAPGDVLFFDTFPNRPGTEHVGIASDLRAPSGHPLVINNWTDGTVTGPMELLSWLAVTHRFRVPPRLRTQGPVHPLKTQLIAAVSPGWNDHSVRLRRFQRRPGGPWRPAGAPIDAVIGHAGYGWGRGLHGEAAPAGRFGPTKREGDGRSPAGVFALGVAYGYAEREARLHLPYRKATPSMRCVDDPASAHYNRIVTLDEIARDWHSAERMRRDDHVYELAIVVAHNTRARRPGAGSCIFLHVWSAPGVPVTGCTAMSEPDLRALASWLEPNAAALVALPESEYQALARPWNLP